MHITLKRARDLGIVFEGETGGMNSITDVPEVEVGHSTIIFGDRESVVGSGPARTGITAILPLGKKKVNSNLLAGASVLNGNGELTGISWLEESGMLSGPVMLTNTYSVGKVRDAVLKYMTDNELESDSLPVVGEISDEYLNDIRGQHIREEHVFESIGRAQRENVEEGNVGGGTGAVCYEFKGGIGTSSRILEVLEREYSVGVIVQANHGLRHHLNINGIPVGQHIRNNLVRTKESGSIVGVIITDAPLLPHQLKRLSRRAFLGLARTGSVSSNGSGDFFLSISTADSYDVDPGSMVESTWIPNGSIDPLLENVVYSTEEAIINALVAAESMSGFGGHYVSAMPHDRVQELLKKRRN